MLQKALITAGVALSLLAPAQAKLYPLSETEVVRYLKVLRTSPEDRERAMAALRLGLAEVNYQKEDLERALSTDPDEQVRLASLISLYVLGARQDLDQIIHSLEKTKLTHYPANLVLAALRYRPDPKRIDWYSDLLVTATIGVNRDNGLRYFAGLILGELNAPSAVRVLEGCFEPDQPVSVRKAAFSGLMAGRGEEARNFRARTLRNDPHLEVRILAAHYLQDDEFQRRFSSGGPLFTPGLELWRVFTESADPLVREAILRSLWGNGFGQEQLEPLMSYLNDETPPGVRDAIERLLEQFCQAREPSSQGSPTSICSAPGLRSRQVRPRRGWIRSRPCGTGNGKRRCIGPQNPAIETDPRSRLDTSCPLMSSQRSLQPG